MKKLNLNSYLREKYPQIEFVWISGNSEKIFISQINIKKEFRNQGFGSKIMTDLIQYADKTKSTLYLTPDDSLGSSHARLVKFYKRFGFVPNKGKNKDWSTQETMLRHSN
jgi:GNAT superfamily N-acetyltransferase